MGSGFRFGARKNYTSFNETPTTKGLLMSEKLEALWNILKNHRGKIAIGLTATAFILLMRRNAKEIESFMAEHGLTEEYHQWLLPEE